MRIAFIWQGFDGRYGAWKDGLWAAMKLIEQKHTVRYFDFPLTDIHDFKPDVVLYWEAPCTLKGGNALNYKAVLDLPYKKALLFAGGPVEASTCYGFDLFFVESRINEEEFEALGLPWRRAFGVNTQIMKPEKQPKVFDGFMQATFAGWKRHILFADALGSTGAVAGRVQVHDRAGYDRCLERGVLVFDELPSQAIATMINASHVVVNTAEYWGGGQRCTLEAMACGVPVVVMSDSPKNREYVEESGAGVITQPDPHEIATAIANMKNDPTELVFRGTAGYTYIQSKWTERHYADAILEGIEAL